MENPRPEKIAVVEEVREKFSSADAALLTEYRGIDVSEMGELRRALREAGGDYKIYKNTLVRLAVDDLGLEIQDLLLGPTAIAFVPPAAGGEGGDAVLVAKALVDFGKKNPHLVVKGGVLGDKILSPEQARKLADIPPRDVLLAQLAGGLQAPMQKFASLLNAVPQRFAYALQALIEQGGAPGAPAPAPEESSEAPAADAAEPAEAETAEAPSAATAEDATTADQTETTEDAAAAADQPEADAAAETEATEES
jgi:large subunit ribosomal protein L10